MIRSQRIRLELIQQHDAERNVFGPDVLMNILIVSAIPFLTYFGGSKLLSALYLLSSILAFLFYRSAMIRQVHGSPIGRWSLRPIRVGLVVLLLMPVFLQWSEGIFLNAQMSFDSGGELGNLPIPVSVIGCYAGILALGMYSRASVSLTMIFFSFVIMVITSLGTFQGDKDLSLAKLILLIQYILPMFAMVLGQMYEGGLKSLQNERGLERAFFWIALTIMVCQLLASWKQSSFILVPSLYFFSVYQHIEYVPIVLLSAVLIGYFGVARYATNQKITLITASIVGLYVGASVISMFLYLFIAAFFFIWWLQGRVGGRTLTVFVLGAIIAVAYTYWGTNFGRGGENLWQGNQYLFHYLEAGLIGAKRAWDYHFLGATSDLQNLFLGHLERPPRSEYPSAHNYYLSVVYNFGLVAILPIVLCICYTAFALVKARKSSFSEPRMLVFGATLAYLLLVQNSASLAMQQPYSAIFIFFIWGVYLSRVTAEASVIKGATGR